MEALIISPIQFPALSLSPAMEQEIAMALEQSALIGKVTNATTKENAVRAQQRLKTNSSTIEKGRKIWVEPLLEEKRLRDNFCAQKRLEIDREYGRITQQLDAFNQAERDRVLEEQRLQREELAKIEREKQAELDRIAREQREREESARRIQEEDARKVLESAEKAAKLAAEATNKKQRESSEKAAAAAAKLAEATRIEKERMDAVLKSEAATAAAASAAIEEKAGDAAFCAAKPVEITRVAGERQTRNWEITSINQHALYRARPDLATEIKFDLRLLKAELDKGVKLPGVDAKEVYTSGVKAATLSKAIDV